jgi:adenine-specific DNA-methyltransferase
VLEPLVGQAGSLQVSLLTVQSLDQIEDYLILAALTESGEPLEEEQAHRLLGMPARQCRTLVTPPSSDPLVCLTTRRQGAILKTISQRNAAFFEAEANKLDGWADDLKAGLEREIKELDRQIKEARRAATAALTLEEKLDAQKRIKAIEAQRNTRRRALFDAQDDIDHRREQLISDIEGKLEQKTTLLELFSIQWKII